MQLTGGFKGLLVSVSCHCSERLCDHAVCV